MKKYSNIHKMIEKKRSIASNRKFERRMRTLSKFRLMKKRKIDLDKLFLLIRE